VISFAFIKLISPKLDLNGSNDGGLLTRSSLLTGSDYKEEKSNIFK
jgi:hypothetical protein